MADVPKIALAAAVVGGYVLGRTKKGRVAFAMATYLAGRRVGLEPQQLLIEGVKRLRELPQFADLNEQLRGEVLDAGRKAMGVVADRKLADLAESLHARTQRIGSKAEEEEEPEDENEPEEEEEEPEDENEPEEEEEPEDENEPEEEEPEDENEPEEEEEEEPAPRRRAAAARKRDEDREAGSRHGRGGARPEKSSAARKAPAKKAPPVKKAVGKKAAPAKTTDAARKSSATPKKTAANKTAAKKTSAGRRR
ncbi:histone protein [Streptomyces sp. NPDC058691]|uniref:histone protein n=1 Tax=Streptomyces sp. NPDC058691 TaxID=3346601 RepID=UPI003652A6CE